MKKRNIFAKELYSKKYRKRVIKPKKGKGSYNRKKLKRSYDIKKHNLLTWKDNTTQNTLIKAEKKIKDLQDKNTSERQIAW